MSPLNSLIIFVISILSFLAPVMGNSLQFLSQDNTERTIFFTPNSGSAGVPSFFVPGISVDGMAVVQFPQGWSGSFKAVLSGENPDSPKITGEITFQGWQGETYYAVSAVQNCCDNSGIRALAPKVHGLTSGCIISPFPCTESYSRLGDIQVKSSADCDFQLIGGNPSMEGFSGDSKYKKILNFWYHDNMNLAGTGIHR
ncbi:hypothetical protein BGAL_0026g00290 [Botrytis galanthina]|uniref:DNase1 protein n=1 Tax=Botrytis galanthina TaxID=278940 RepID=A0A4S8R8Y3_9HELO|nr:hypothetical protein BGAL_0026g00290 [Botrytis galanthina]